MRVRVFQHVPFEGTGSMGQWMGRHGVTPALTRFFAGETPARDHAFDLLIVMGGPMSVNDTAVHPWLSVEMDLIASAVAAGRPVLGICLGAQLIARALGARVFPHRVKEIGWFPVRATSAPRTGIAAHLPGEFLAFHWHGETFDLPPGTVDLFSSAACSPQAFQAGDSVLGLQFHLETTPETARAMMENCAEDLAPGPFVQDAAEILGEPGRFTTINLLMDGILDAYLRWTSS